MERRTYMPKLKHVPFQFMNELKDDKQIITLSGSVRKKWYEDDQCIDEASVQEALSQATTPVVIRLNSPGGDVFEGISIYNLLKDSERDVTVEVTGVAASAASIIAMGANRIVMCKGSSLMIHEASTWAIGNKADIQKTLNALETIDSSIISIYAEKTGLDDATLNDYLVNETWFTAKEAVETGFADEVKKVAADEIEQTAMMNSVAVEIKLSEELQNALDEIKEVTALLKEEKPKKLKIFGGNK